MCGNFAEETKPLSYVRAFSDLGQYQQAHEIIYQLKAAQDGYILSLHQGSSCEQVKVAVSQQEAKQLLVFLYENAVTVEIWRDVLMDLDISC